MLDVKVYAAIAALETGSPVAGAEAFKIEPNLTPFEFTQGALVGQASWFYVAAVALGPSGNETINLYGSIKDVLGNTINAALVKGIQFNAASTNGALLTLEGGASDPFLFSLGGTTPTQSVDAGGILLQSSPNGWAVTSGTAQNLKIVNTDSVNPATGQIFIWGN